MPRVLPFLRVLVVALAGCGRSDGPLAPSPEPTLDRLADGPPVVEVPVGGAVARFWPFASSDLATPDDPINLVFGGRADPRRIPGR
ncbi:MAG: hypothetical protein R2909_12455 [Gemmatimonadales bacterium]